MGIFYIEEAEMNFIEDEMGQGAAEYVLLFGGVIVIAIAALTIYGNYFKGSSVSSSKDIASVRGSIN